MKIKQIDVPNSYEAYLMTDQFDRIRQAVFKRDNYRCVICGSTDKIQPHHLTYRNLYHEPPEDLITLCRDCHSIYHAIDKRRNAVETIYQHEDLRRKAEEASNSYENIKTISAKITKEIKEEYLLKDYCKNGDLDMCAWEVLNRIKDAKCAK